MKVTASRLARHRYELTPMVVIREAARSDLGRPLPPPQAASDTAASATSPARAAKRTVLARVELEAIIAFFRILSLEWWRACTRRASITEEAKAASPHLALCRSGRLMPAE